MGHLSLERYGSRSSRRREHIGRPLVFAVDRPTPVDWSRTEFGSFVARFMPVAAGSLILI
ncbi:hypothetical protein C5689_00160 [Methylosinus sporium]|uniref:Uncharacterized protein n=1 Tax=Methylosinus sporium TaxID=428 RepID=A0A2U1SVC6_METSR|nr:hypothetical protein C5689_00160 [Methylosinus sporium]